MSTTKPTVDTRAYGKQLATIENGEIKIDLTKDSQAPNANAYTRVAALDQLFANSANVGKTITVTFRAKASMAGAMDFAFNKLGSFNTYAYGGTTYKTQYNLTTEYQTYSYTFTVLEDMITTHASTNINLAFRLYNGFGGSTGEYYSAQIYIDDIRVYEELNVGCTTRPITDFAAVSGSGISTDLTVYADDSATGAPEIYKTYLAYNLKDVNAIYAANLSVGLNGVNGETVRVYVIGGTLPSPLTYANAPLPTGGIAGSFVAKNGTNTVDITDAIAEYIGQDVVIILTVEEPSDRIAVTADPVLNLTKDFHDHSSPSQRHEANAPTYTTGGNVEFYTCQGCEKLYVKQGDSFVEVEAEDVFIPAIEHASILSGASLNIGEDLSVRYHITLGEGESIDGYAVTFYMGADVVTVTDYEFDTELGKYVFYFRGIAPQSMGDNIRAELAKDGVTTDIKAEYSVKEYVVATLENHSDNKELCRLLTDMLVYGAEAQLYKGYKTDELVTDGVDLSAASVDIPTELDKNKSVTPANGEVQFTAAGVRFDYANSIYVKLSAHSVDGVTVYADGVALLIVESDTAGEYIAYSNPVSALEFGEKVTFTLSVGGNAVQTLVYTVNDYVLTKYTDGEIGALSLALYRYGKSAVAYKNSL